MAIWPLNTVFSTYHKNLIYILYSGSNADKFHEKCWVYVMFFTNLVFILMCSGYLDLLTKKPIIQVGSFM